MTTDSPYITASEIIDLFGQQEVLDAFEVQSVEELANSAIHKYIENANAIIDAHIAVRYEIPLQQPIPHLVRRIAAAIVRYDYHNFDSRERVEGAYREALRFLQYLRNGKIDLDKSMARTRNAPRFNLEKNNEKNDSANY